jgi:hypothetical protein
MRIISTSVPVESTTLYQETKLFLASLLNGEWSADVEQHLRKGLKPDEFALLQEVQQNKTIKGDLLPFYSRV